MDMAAWLRALELERYIEAFEANDIDATVLHTLNADDLKDLGVASLGHRKKLLEAISALEDSAETLAPAGGREAERRQLTVMFCDLVGSTELAARLDPEDLGQVIRTYQGCCAEVVARWGGHVAKYMGDGVLAYFGWPQAHEDEAERAVRAGLALTSAVGQLSNPGDEPLAARVGIATGLVMVGELIGEGAAQEQAVVGETPNLAARLQALAAPGSVVISQATRRLIGGLFELADLGPQRLKGFAEPLAAFRVEGEGGAEGRFEALHGEHLTPLVGREHELGILLERWAWAKDGDGQVVLLSGEPGIGKSRLLRALRERLRDEPYTPLSHYGSPYHTNSTLHPVIGLLERAAAFRPEDTPATRLDKLEAVLAEATENLTEVVPLIAALLLIPTESRYPPINLTPAAQKVRTLEALLGQIAGLAERRPVLMVIEDAQWIDPTTSELIGLTIDRVQRLPLLLVMTFRPEFTPPWSGYPHTTSLTLSRLGQRQGAVMVERLTASKPLPAEVLEQILVKTDGVPLFVEELTKTVLGSGLLVDAGDRFELSGPLQPLAIPTTLHDSLMARLDRLAPVKEVAQVGAVIGREFSYQLLAAVLSLGDSELQDALAQLVESELIFRRGAPPGSTYSFKHALVQDTAYQSLLRSRRQQLHARIAEALERLFGGSGEIQPELLARHFSDGGLGDRAIPYWRQAGALAAGRSANVEAIAHLGKGLELIATLPDADEELALRLSLGGPLIATRGYPAPEVEQNYTRALALCEQLGRSADLLPVLRGLWNCCFIRGELQTAYELAKRLVALADEQGGPLRHAHTCRALGSTLFCLGRLTDASEQLERGIALDRTVEDLGEHRAHALLHGEHPGAFCRMYLAWALWLLGYPDQALETLKEALDLGQRLAHPYSMATPPSFASVLHNWRGEFSAAREQADAVIATAGKHQLPLVIAIGTIVRGSALVGLGERKEGTAQLRSGLAAWNGVGAHLLDTQWFGLTAEACLRMGKFDNALIALDRAAEIAAATGEHYYQAELCRLRGLVLARTGEEAEAAASLQRAIDTARSQQARSLELRAATSLARLWADQGERQKAHDLLAPVHAWFTEGFETAGLKDAKALLDALG